MLAIKKSEKEATTPLVVASILPCRIQHNGPVNASTRHWTPEETQPDGNKNSTAYFRGRKLKGKVLELPEGFRGTMLQKTNTVLAPPTSTPSFNNPEQQQQQEEEEEGPTLETTETKILQEIATFDKLVVWGHEVQPNEQEDVYLRGVNEWIGLARSMNSC